MKRLIISALASLACLASLSAAPVFDTLSFGDSKDEVTKKLLASKLAKTELDETFFARTGLNGVFRTTVLLEGEAFDLFFNFDDSNRLTEIVFRSDAKGGLDKALKVVQSATRLLSNLHGIPAQAGDPPKASQLPVDGSYLYTVWHPEDGGTTLTGVGRTDKGYHAMISMRADHIELQATE